MLNILTLCCALDNSYFAIKYKGEIFSKILKSDVNYHSLYLINEIKNTLKEKNIDLKEIDLIGVNCGPGSFTGIRVAMSIAKVMAGELNLPLVGLNTSQILLRIYDKKYLIMDARRDMFFVGDKDKIELKLKDEVVEKYNSSEIVCDKNSKEFFKDAICFEEETKDIGSVMVKLTEEIYNKEQDKTKFDYKMVEPNYIQTPPVF